MGLFSFVKNAGAKIFGHKTVAPTIATAPIVDANATAATAAADAIADQNSRLTEAINDLGLQATGLSVEFNPETSTATLYGTVMTTSEKEKIVLAVGNSEGVETVDDQLSVMNPEPESTFYQVKPGDSLSRIAQEMYGKASKYPLIFHANEPMLKDPDHIYPGQTLRIPPLPA